MLHASNRSLVVFGDSLSDNGNLFNLIGRPTPPYWNGHFSNGPTYAEQLAQMLGVRLDDRAFGFGEASDASVPLLVDPATGQPLPINLSDQVAGYIAGLHGHRAPPQTTVVINMGSNDYQSYLFSDLPKDLPTVQQQVGNVIGGIAQAIDDLTSAGISKIVLFTLPDLAITPIAQSLGPDAVAFAHLLDVVNNNALMQLAASHPGIQVVDLFQLSDAIAADPQAFGLNSNLSLTWVDLLAAGSTQFAPNEIGFFEEEHPTTAAHGVIAAFTDATLRADHVQFLDGTQSIVHAQRGDNFIFAKALDPTDSHLSGDYTIYGNAGADVIVAGPGDVTVHGEAGDDVISAGAGDARLFGGRGDDLLATNSKGMNTLDGGGGDDVLIANRAGTSTLNGGEGDDLFVLKQSSALVNPSHTFDFGTQKIAGGEGHDTLRFVINDQDPAAKAAFVAEFLKIEAAFDFAAVHHHAGSFQVDGLDVSGVERLELQIDSVSHNPQTPYLITHDIVLADGNAGHQDPAVAANLHTAESWGWTTV